MKPSKQLLIRRATRLRTPVAAAIIAAGLLAAGATQGCADEPQKTGGPVKVQIVETNGGYQLYVDHKAFYIKGAGIEFGSQEKLKEHGGNSFRTWSTDNSRDSGQEILERAAGTACTSRWDWTWATSAMASTTMTPMPSPGNLSP